MGSTIDKKVAARLERALPDPRGKIEQPLKASEMGENSPLDCAYITLSMLCGAPLEFFGRDPRVPDWHAAGWRVCDVGPSHRWNTRTDAIATIDNPPADAELRSEPCRWHGGTLALENREQALRILNLEKSLRGAIELGGAAQAKFLATQKAYKALREELMRIRAVACNALDRENLILTGCLEEAPTRSQIYEFLASNSRDEAALFGVEARLAKCSTDDDAGKGEAA